ncbi:hypothetical protein JCM11491_007063 [Sporobolomyces phaffii]
MPPPAPPSPSPSPSPSPRPSRTDSVASRSLPVSAPRLPPKAQLSGSPPHLLHVREPEPATSVSQNRAEFAEIIRPRRSSQADLELGTARGAANDNQSVEQRTRAPSVSQLSWGTWWPFQVVGPPGDAPEPTPPTPPRKDTRRDSVLSLVAGRQSVEAARRGQEALAEQDQAEANLLDIDVDALRRLSMSSSASTDKEADDSPFRTLEKDKSLPPTPSRSASSFPSLFSTTSPRASSSSTGSPSPSASLLSSFTLANPFAPSSTSAAGPRPSLSRHYTTHRHAKDDEGPTARKGEVEDMVDDADKEAVEEEAQDNAEIFSILKDRYRTPKLPIVFCHGLFGFDHLGPASIKPLQFSYWVGVQEALEAMGVEVLIGRVPASASIEERAKVLCEMIGERFPGREVNLIGHSMGGLDARFLISRLQPTNFKVRSLITIATPHRGSSFADYLLEDVVGTSRVPMMLGMLSTLGVPGGGKAFDDLTTSKMARFNLDTPDDSAVRYFSYGAEFSPSWSNVFRVPWGVVNEREGPNDGLVSVESAKWGEYQATLHNVNHLDLIGMVGKVRYGWASWLGTPIKFKPISFFCSLAEKLADEGL